jgi:hypothetical protein
MEKRFILAHDFRGFSPWSLGPVVFERQNIMVEA